MSKIDEIKEKCHVEKEFLLCCEGVDDGAYVLNESDIEELIQLVRDECNAELDEVRSVGRVIVSDIFNATNYYCENSKGFGDAWLVCKLNDIITDCQIVSGERGFNGKLIDEVNKK